ncbi:MAG: DUF2027 domain-containing protein [Macellibacteroides fermentans]|uniref:DUF2027 domain-containing protein n=1 Tax=Macellibacteroides fermentans TaxID=879969 RepID=UPI003AD2135A
MNVKIGDKVRFLNSVGGGIVRRFKGNDQVIVEDEDGFDIPVLIRECVVVGDNMMTRSSAGRPSAPAPQVQVTAPAPQPEKVEETAEGERLNVFLAYLPIDPKSMQQTRYEAYFVNESNYFLFYNYMSRQNNSWMSRSQGLIEPNTKIFMEEFGKEDLNELERICVQFIAFKKDKPYAMKNSVSVELRLDTVKFYKLHCFLDNDYFDEPAILTPIVRQDIPERQMLISAAAIQEAMQQKVREEKVTPTVVKKKAEAPIIEVDLHTEQILDTTAGMDSTAILNYQLDKFHEVLKEYAGVKGQKIVFIHGKGEGVLRKAIENELKTKYKQYFYQDASFREYGFGATMVTIK